MDLRNNTITVGELLDTPAAYAVFQRRFGRWANHPIVSKSRSLTLAQLIQLASAVIPQNTIRDTLSELKRI